MSPEKVRSGLSSLRAMIQLQHSHNPLLAEVVVTEDLHSQHHQSPLPIEGLMMNPVRILSVEKGNLQLHAHHV